MSRSGPSPFDLSGQRALVTGGSRGIGAAIAMQLAAAGAHVFINYREDDASARRTAERILADGGAAETLRANLAQPDDVRSMFESIGATGRLDILVHSAALGSFKRTLDVRANQWDLTLSINARAFLLCAQHAARLMAGGSGRIVAVSSLGGARVIPSYGVTGVSKAALEALTRYLGVELAPAGINVNAVAAGLVDTSGVRHHPQFDAMVRRAIEATPAGRLGSADEIARVVLFLCSPVAGWIVGQTLVVDGGMSLQI